MRSKRKRINHKAKCKGNSIMIPIPNTQSASYGVAGFNGKVEIKFDEEIAVLLREIVENFEEVAVTCEKKRA